MFQNNPCPSKKEVLNFVRAVIGTMCFILYMRYRGIFSFYLDNYIECVTEDRIHNDTGYSKMRQMSI